MGEKLRREVNDNFERQCVERKSEVKSSRQHSFETSIYVIPGSGISAAQALPFSVDNGTRQGIGTSYRRHEGAYLIVMGFLGRMNL
jgi:hypothetical protein